MILENKTNCINCDKVIVDIFCSNCGQKKYKRIDRKYITDEIKYTVFHANKGLFYSVKQIIKNPGKTAKEFIYGNRVNHYKPIMLVFLLSGISTFISFKVIGLDHIMAQNYANQKSANFMNSYMSFVSNYYSFVMLLALPIIALITKLAFYKWHHNYYEHIIMNAYGLSFYTIFTILIQYPIYYFCQDDFSTIMTISMSSLLIIPFIMVWFFKEIYKEKSLKSIILRVLGVVGMFFVLYIAIIIAGVVGYLIFNGVEGLKTMQPVK